MSAFISLWLGVIIGVALGYMLCLIFKKPSITAPHPLGSEKRSEAPIAQTGIRGGSPQSPPAIAPPAVFQSGGKPLAIRAAWGDVLHEEQAPMFMDQFLLRYFYDLVQPIDENARGRPWDLFVQKNPWAKEMPVLFHQLTSIKLTDMQLNGAIADYMSRAAKQEPTNG